MCFLVAQSRMLCVVGCLLLPRAPLPITMIAMPPITLVLVVWQALLSGPTLPPKVPAQARESPPIQIVKWKRKNGALPPKVQGNLLDEMRLFPLAIGVVRVRGALFHADVNGAYRWQGKRGTYVFRARSVGYADVVSQRIRVVRGDSIRLDFRLPIGPPIVHKMPY